MRRLSRSSVIHAEFVLKGSISNVARKVMRPILSDQLKGRLIGALAKTLESGRSILI